jgi:hypothetical protein
MESKLQLKKSGYRELLIGSLGIAIGQKAELP